MGPPANQHDEERTQDQVREATGGEDLVGVERGGVQEGLSDRKVCRRSPVLCRGIERQPVSEEEHGRQQHFDERRILRVQAKVAPRQIRIAFREVRALVVGRRVCLDEHQALGKEQHEQTARRQAGEMTLGVRPQVDEPPGS